VKQDPMKMHDNITMMLSNLFICLTRHIYSRRLDI